MYVLYLSALLTTTVHENDWQVFVLPRRRACKPQQKLINILLSDATFQREIRQCRWVSYRLRNGHINDACEFWSCNSRYDVVYAILYASLDPRPRKRICICIYRKHLQYKDDVDYAIYSNVFNNAGFVDCP